MENSILSYKRKYAVITCTVHSWEEKHAVENNEWSAKIFIFHPSYSSKLCVNMSSLLGTNSNTGYQNLKLDDRRIRTKHDPASYKWICLDLHLDIRYYIKWILGQNPKSISPSGFFSQWTCSSMFSSFDMFFCDYNIPSYFSPNVFCGNKDEGNPMLSSVSDTKNSRIFLKVSNVS